MRLRELNGLGRLSRDHKRGLLDELTVCIEEAEAEEDGVGGWSPGGAGEVAAEERELAGLAASGKTSGGEEDERRAIANRAAVYGDLVAETLWLTCGWARQVRRASRRENAIPSRIASRAARQRHRLGVDGAQLPPPPPLPKSLCWEVEGACGR